VNGERSARDTAALDLLAEAVVLVDDTGLVRHGNDRARALLGFSGDEVGRPFDDVCILHDASGLRWIPQRERPGVGDRLPERVVYATVRGSDRPLAVAGRWSDVGLALTFRSAGRRDRLDAVRGDLVATVSHEIRSPLTSVKGFTRTMLAKWERFSDDQKRAMLETIDADADRVTRLLGELLDVSRIDAGRVQLHRRPLDVGDVVAEVVDKARHRQGGGDRELTLELDPDAPQVYADRDKLVQVLTNLVDNAFTHATEGDVRVGVTGNAEGVHLTVADEGPGVAPDQQALIFQKFGRARESRSGGTGLGLYITRGLVEAHGGDVWVESKPDEGARFHVTLPAHERG
jgi:signal transduction histidine kinase